MEIREPVPEVSRASLPWLQASGQCPLGFGAPRGPVLALRRLRAGTARLVVVGSALVVGEPLVGAS